MSRKGLSNVSNSPSLNKEAAPLIQKTAPKATKVPDWSKIHEKEKERVAKGIAKNKKPTTVAKEFNFATPSTKGANGLNQSRQDTSVLGGEEFFNDMHAMESILTEKGIEERDLPKYPVGNKSVVNKSHQEELNRYSILIQGLESRRRTSMHHRLFSNGDLEAGESIDVPRTQPHDVIVGRPSIAHVAARAFLNNNGHSASLSTVSLSNYSKVKALQQPTSILVRNEEPVSVLSKKPKAAIQRVNSKKNLLLKPDSPKKSTSMENLRTPMKQPITPKPDHPMSVLMTDSRKSILITPRSTRRPMEPFMPSPSQNHLAPHNLFNDYEQDDFVTSGIEKEKLSKLAQLEAIRQRELQLELELQADFEAVSGSNLDESLNIPRTIAEVVPPTTNSFLLPVQQSKTPVSLRTPKPVRNVGIKLDTSAIPAFGFQNKENFLGPQKPFSFDDDADPELCEITEKLKGQPLTNRLELVRNPLVGLLSTPEQTKPQNTFCPISSPISHKVAPTRIIASNSAFKNLRC